jgi:hypothetical protein
MRVPMARGGDEGRDDDDDEAKLVSVNDDTLELGSC